MNRVRTHDAWILTNENGDPAMGSHGLMFVFKDLPTARKHKVGYNEKILKMRFVVLPEIEEPKTAVG